MVKKRISASVIVKSNKVVQSISYKKYLPIGSIEPVVENLDRWGVDEIIIFDIDRSKKNLGPNYDLIKAISSIPISTPLAYAGGINNYKDAIRVISSGSERVIVDNLFFKNSKNIKNISDVIGSQALLLSLPLSMDEDRIFHYNYVNKKSKILDVHKILDLKPYFSELIIVDYLSQGCDSKFDISLLEVFNKNDIDLVCYGGIGVGELPSQILTTKNVKSIAFGNILNYGELKFQEIKKSIKYSKKNLRRSIFRERI
tara:strand:- start:16632 stop:17402 length:771 start_codon:yes stop_codon:yes gene_type:complete